MNAKIKRITDEDRRIIYEMWTNGYTQVEIAEALHISVGSLRNEMLKGFNGEFYVGGRKVYDPNLASRYTGKAGRSRFRDMQRGALVDPTIKKK